MKNLNGDGKLLQNKMLRLLIKQRNMGFVALFLQKHKYVGYFLKTNFPLPHSFIDILYKYKFHDESGFFVNQIYVTKFLSNGIYSEYIPRTSKKEVCIITDEIFPLEKNINFINS